MVMLMVDTMVLLLEKLLAAKLEMQKVATMGMIVEERWVEKLELKVVARMACRKVVQLVGVLGVILD